MIPEELQKSNLARELKAGKRRLEDALRGLRDESCKKTGATRSDSVIDVLSEIVRTEIYALAEVFERAPGLPMNHSTNVDVRARIGLGKLQVATSGSIQDLLGDFCVVRSVLLFSRCSRWGWLSSNHFA